jgi:hypothetical protein
MNETPFADLKLLAQHLRDFVSATGDGANFSCRGLARGKPLKPSSSNESSWVQGIFSHEVKPWPISTMSTSA